LFICAFKIVNSGFVQLIDWRVLYLSADAMQKEGRWERYEGRLSSCFFHRSHLGLRLYGLVFLFLKDWGRGGGWGSHQLCVWCHIFLSVPMRVACKGIDRRDGNDGCEMQTLNMTWSSLQYATPVIMAVGKGWTFPSFPARSAELRPIMICDPISRGLVSLECMTHISKILPLGRAEVEMCPIKKTADEEITGIGVVCLESDWSVRRVLGMVKIKEV